MDTGPSELGAEEAEERHARNGDDAIFDHGDGAGEAAGSSSGSEGDWFVPTTAAAAVSPKKSSKAAAKKKKAAAEQHSQDEQEEQHMRDEQEKQKKFGDILSTKRTDFPRYQAVSRERHNMI